jgi:hypothetical protein
MVVVMLQGFELKNSCNRDVRCSSVIINNLSGYYTRDLGVRTCTETFSNFLAAVEEREGMDNDRKSENSEG